MEVYSMVRDTSLWSEYADSLDCTETGSGWFGVRIRHGNSHKTAFICSFTDHRGDGTMPDEGDLPDIDQFDFVAVKCPQSLGDGVRSWLQASELLLLPTYPHNMWTEYDFSAGRNDKFECLGAAMLGVEGCIEKLPNNVLVNLSSPPEDRLWAVIADSAVNPADLDEPGVGPFNVRIHNIDVIVGLWMKNTAAVRDLMERAAWQIDYHSLPPRPSKIASSVAPTYSHAARTPARASVDSDTEDEDDELSIMVTRLNVGDRGAATKRAKRPRAELQRSYPRTRARTRALASAHPRTRAQARALAHAHSHMDTDGGGVKTQVYTMPSFVVTVMCALASGFM